MTPERLCELADLQRARDFIDRNYASPLDVPAMAEAACMSSGPPVWLIAGVAAHYRPGNRVTSPPPRC